MKTVCYLRKLEQADLPKVFPLYTDPAVREFLGGPVSVEVAEQRASDLLADGMTWAIIGSCDDDFAGTVTLHRHHDGVSTEMSYSLLQEHMGKGYATVALQLMLTHAFVELGLPAVVSETQAANIRSTRLLERIGMQPRERLMRFGVEQIIYTIHALSRPPCIDRAGQVHLPQY